MNGKGLMWIFFTSPLKQILPNALIFLIRSLLIANENLSFSSKYVDM